MSHSFSTFVVLAGIFNLAFALFHMAFWRLFQWPASLGSMGHINRGILYVLNLALTAIFILTGVLLLVYPDDVENTGLGLALLWGLTLFWLARAAVQPAVFGLKRRLSIVLFLVFLFGAGVHGLAAWSRSAI
jgi:hypothetical protein